MALIGGSGLESLLEGVQPLRIGTPYGPIKLQIGRIAETEVIYLPRHGEKHTVPPHRINYRGNASALKTMGVRRTIATNAVGSLNPDIGPSKLLVPLDVLDFTRSRPSTMYEGNPVVHVDMSQPFCPELREVLLEAGRQERVDIRDGGVIGCMEGPRFETPAEIKMLQHLGADLVGMTTMPEAVLFREMEICYATLAYVSNMAAGMQAKITTSEVTAVGEKVLRIVRRVLAKAIPRIPMEPSCECGRALRQATV